MMKKAILCLATAAICAGSALALPKAFYVKQGDKITKYNFGVAENLIFSDNGHKLSVRGYDDVIDLDAIDYISFSAPLTEALTPSAQKQRLIQIGQDAYSAFSLYDQQDLLVMWHDFFDDDYDYNQGETTYLAPASMEVPAEYYAVHGEVTDVAKAARALVAGNPAAARALANAAVNYYKLEDYHGIYTANAATGSWVKSAGKGLELRFTGRKGTAYSVKLTHGDTFTTWTTSDFKGQFPRDITITLSAAGKTLATVTLNTVLADRKRIDMTMTFVAGEYKVVNKMAVVDAVIDDDVTVTIRGKQFLTADTRITGRNFVSYEEIYGAIDATKDKYDDNTGEYIPGDTTRIVAMFGRGETSVDLLGKLQVRGMLYNGPKAYEELNRDPEVYYEYVQDGITYTGGSKILSGSNNGTLHITDADTGIFASQANFLNSYSDAGFYYDGTEKLQGYLGWDYTEDVYERTAYYDPEYDTYAYTRIGDILLPVSRDKLYDNQGNPYYTQWHLNGSRRTSDQWEYVETPVDDSKVIRPQVFQEHYYDLSPVLWFPDGTSFAFGDFFDENTFRTLIDDYDDIIDTYFKITGQERTPDNYK